MPDIFAHFFHQHLDAFTHAWVDEIYSDRRTHLPLILSTREQIEFLPEVIDEIAFMLDHAASRIEIAEAAGRLRVYAQVRFQQGVLIDEMARELMLLREMLNRLLCEESSGDAEENMPGRVEALRRANLFFDELLVQAILIYAACLRPRVMTRDSAWPPSPRRRRQD